MITKDQYDDGCELWLRRSDDVERSYYDDLKRHRWDAIKDIANRYYTSEEEARLDMLERQLWRLNGN